ncbi:hypothetical protein [Methylobacter sp. S3L5C]|uniref:hypothetical protein n=1 Tax=Methylobacter sp. S3L5C TaxID=2839024 RepID=UPI001FADB9C2|nr:hypothetical protein [Methylobacter sp. S3L5C]UOA08663.1 hypothetical protein KKZ03_21150 [Methylobacter sp. S3L5C]
MSGFITGEARTHATLFPEKLDDYISADNATRVIDIFIDGIDLSATGFKTLAAATGPDCVKNPIYAKYGLRKTAKF